MTPIEALAAVYLVGAHLCIRDDAALGVLATRAQEAALRRCGAFEAIEQHHDEVRGIVLAGIATALDGWQPTLTGLEHLDREQA